jgi:hypothetical protein
MPGLAPGIHVLLPQKRKQDVDGRDKPGHDGESYNRLCCWPLSREVAAIQGENATPFNQTS